MLTSDDDVSVARTTQQRRQRAVIAGSSVMAATVAQHRSGAGEHKRIEIVRQD